MQRRLIMSIFMGAIYLVMENDVCLRKKNELSKLFVFGKYMLRNIYFEWFLLDFL